MNWIHLHLALNHVPVLGTFFVGLLLATAILKKNEELKRLSLSWMVGLAVISIPIKFTGDFAFEMTQNAPWLQNDLAMAHEKSADQATTGMFLLGLAAFVALFAGRRKPQIPRWATIVTVVLVMLTFALMARTSQLGGQLRHPEIHSPPQQPAQENSG